MNEVKFDPSLIQVEKREVPAPLVDYALAEIRTRDRAVARGEEEIREEGLRIELFEFDFLKPRVRAFKASTDRPKSFADDVG